MTASDPPETVTALSVELGSISLATWIEAPVISRISLIFEPPLPMREPHWEAGTTSLKVIGGLGTVPGEIRLLRSCGNGKTYFQAKILTDLLRDGNKTHQDYRELNLTSSNLLHMRVKALKIDSVFPVTVTIRSGQLPSLMLILAPL